MNMVSTACQFSESLSNRYCLRNEMEHLPLASQTFQSGAEYPDVESIEVINEWKEIYGLACFN